MAQRNKLLLSAVLALPFLSPAVQIRDQGKTGLGELVDYSIPTPISEDVETRMGQSGYIAVVKEGRNAWPGIRFIPKTGVFDLHRFGHIEAMVINAGRFPLWVTVRMENSGSARDRHWREKTLLIAPGQESDFELPFRDKKRRYKFDSSKVMGFTILARPKKGAKVDGARAIMVSNLQAAGTQGENPELPRHRADGFGGMPRQPSLN